jgi:regulatory protein
LASSLRWATSRSSWRIDASPPDGVQLRAESTGGASVLFERAAPKAWAKGILDDAKFAEQFARSKIVSTGASKRRLTQDLYRKGIKGDVATAAIANVVEQDEIDPAAVIERVAKKKLAQLGELEPLTLRRRLFGFLARRGYDLDEIKRVVHSLVS